jgi:hypothetical protein
MNINLDIKSKILLELKGKKGFKKSINYCYIDNGNKKSKIDITKYKLNCVIPKYYEENNDNENDFNFYNLFSKYYLLNYGIKEIFKEIDCFSPNKTITAFYFYYDKFF